MDCQLPSVVSDSLLRMGRLLIVLAALSIQVRSSAEMPPRVTACRSIFIARQPDNGTVRWTEEYEFPSNCEYRLCSLLLSLVYPSVERLTGRYP